MSHRKIRSQGYVAFSWEEKPGVSKSNHQKSSSDMGLKILSQNFSCASDHVRANQRTKIAPPPPCSAFQPPRKKSFSLKGLRWQDDPFLAALKSCTKSVPKHDRESIREKRNGESSKGKNIISKSSVFSCKESCNVESDNFVEFTKLPPLPKGRYKAKSFVRNSHISN